MTIEKIKAIEKDIKQAFREQLVEMHPMLGRDMHNRPPLHDVQDKYVEEIEDWILAAFRQSLISLLEAEAERLKGEIIEEIKEREEQWVRDENSPAFVSQSIIKIIQSLKSPADLSAEG